MSSSSRATTRARTARPGAGSRSAPTRPRPTAPPGALPGADGNRALRAVATDLSSNTGQDVHNVTIDRTAPGGGSVSYLDGYDTTGSLTITTADGTDSGSGVDPASGLLERDSATLANGDCGSFPGSWTTVTSPDSGRLGQLLPLSLPDLRPRGQRRHLHLGERGEGRHVRPAAPEPCLLGLHERGLAGGQTVYFRSGPPAASRSTASSSDAQSGIGDLRLPGARLRLERTPSRRERRLHLQRAAADPVEPNNVTAQNNAGLTSAPTSFTVTADGSAPASSIACNGAACRPAGTRAPSRSPCRQATRGSGLQEIRYTTDGTDPSPVNGTVYSVAFNVAVDDERQATAPTTESETKRPSAPSSSRSTTAPRRPRADPRREPGERQPARRREQRSSTTRRRERRLLHRRRDHERRPVRDPQGHLPRARRNRRRRRRLLQPLPGLYCWTSASSASGSQTVTARNNAGLTTSSTFTVTPDTAPPAGGSSATRRLRERLGHDHDRRRHRRALGRRRRDGRHRARLTLLVGGNCDPFAGAWSAVTSPDSTIVSGHCYQYRYRVSDNVGNDAVYTSANVVKVSTSAPGAPT